MEAITPLPVPPDAGVLLYGGSFDPPHVAHVELALAARDVLEQESSKAGSGGGVWLVYVPAARSPHKDAGPVATAAQRVRMLELALEDRPRVGIWTDEIDRATGASPGAAPEPSYWINTVRRARSLLGASRWLRFLIGADQAVQFHRWREARQILKLAEPAIMGRGEIDSAADLRRAMAQAAGGFWSDAELDQWAGWFVDVGVRRASSTAIRGGSDDALPRAVEAYIQREGVYG